MVRRAHARGPSPQQQPVRRMPQAPLAGGPLDELSLELLQDSERLLAWLAAHWQIAALLWLAANCGAGLLLAQLHLWRKRRQRAQKTE